MRVRAPYASRMVDIHHHILPGLDDGPADWPTALEMARQARAAGVAAVVATPHLMPGRPGGPSATLIAERVDELRARLAAAGIDLEVLAGAEVYPTPDLPGRVKAGEIPALGRGGRVRYLLVDTPLDVLPPQFEYLLFEMRLAGVTPVIAHPERSPTLAASPERLHALVQQGALAQVTAASLLGRFGSRACQAGWAFLARGLACAVASDAHDPVHRSPQDMGRALEAVSNRLGEALARALFVTHPRQLALGEPLEEPGTGAGGAGKKQVGWDKGEGMDRAAKRRDAGRLSAVGLSAIRALMGRIGRKV